VIIDKDPGIAKPAAKNNVRQRTNKLSCFLNPLQSLVDES
jgi:hypothetical protein